MRLFVNKNILTLTKSVYKVNPITIRNFAKVLHNEHVTPLLNEETLKGRILNFLNIDKRQNNIKINNNKPLENVINQYNNLENLNFDDLLYFINSIKKDPDTYYTELQKFDIECSTRISDLNVQEIFSLLNAFMNIAPGSIINLKFYQVAINEISTMTKELSKQELLQLFFYIGLQKKKVSNHHRATLRKCMKAINEEFIDKLTLEELCVICHSFFKTSTKIENPLLLDKIKSLINDNLKVLDDQALFITLIKTIRHNRYQDDDLLNTVACTMFFNNHLPAYTFISLCHLMTLFADYHYYDKNVIKCFTEKCLKIIRESSHEQIRTKDIKRLLFCLSNYTFLKPLEKEDIENVIMPKIMEQIDNGEFKNDIDSLIDITLFLWMLNYQAHQLVPYFTNENYLKALENKKSPSKERLNLLLHCIFIENRDLYNSLNVRPMLPQPGSSDYHILRRPFLQRIYKTLKTNKVQVATGLKRFEISYEIPYINIIGITAYKKNIYKAVFIEILDDATCLKNVPEDAPVGLMELKLRLLNKREEGLIVLSEKELESTTESELEDILIDEIKLVY